MVQPPAQHVQEVNIRLLEALAQLVCLIVTVAQAHQSAQHVLLNMNGQDQHAEAVPLANILPQVQPVHLVCQIAPVALLGPLVAHVIQDIIRMVQHHAQLVWQIALAVLLEPTATLAPLDSSGVVLLVKAV